MDSLFRGYFREYLHHASGESFNVGPLGDSIAQRPQHVDVGTVHVD
jgi:hypothetical protein